MGTTTSDRVFMEGALALARRGLGRTWPNPSVGCVLVKDGRVVGRGRTADGGRPHAEPQSLAMAGSAAWGATAYVSLEPCSHHGQTPPCADALIEAGIARVVVAVGDPDPRVAGAGLARLRQAGIAVTQGVLEAQAADLNAGFFLAKTQGRPLVTVKLATTLDGRIAAVSGASQWITGPDARRMGHLMRAGHDAVMVGIGTALNDDPELTCRLPGLQDRPPVSVVVDSGLSLPIDGKLAMAAKARPVWVLARMGADEGRRARLEALGVKVLPVPPGEEGAGGRVSMPQALSLLADRGLTRIMVEGGAGLVTSLIDADLVDRLVWFRAAALMGGDGLAALGPLGLAQLDAMPRFRPTDVQKLGQDAMETYVRI